MPPRLKIGSWVQYYSAEGKREKNDTCGSFISVSIEPEDGISLRFGRAAVIPRPHHQHLHF